MVIPISALVVMSLNKKVNFSEGNLQVDANINTQYFSISIINNFDIKKSNKFMYCVSNTLLDLIHTNSKLSKLLLLLPVGGH